MTSSAESPGEPGPPRLTVELLWSLLAFGAYGFSGILINIAIAAFQGPEKLGAFNQVYALYLFLSQLSVGGAHLSALFYLSSGAHEHREHPDIVVSALAISTLWSAAVIAVVWAAHGVIGTLLSSTDVAVGLLAALPGLLFFSLNKVLLNTLNALPDLRGVALFSALRAVLVLAGVLIIAGGGFAGGVIAAAISISEALLFLFIALSTVVRPRLKGRISASWGARHFRFGSRSIPGALLAEANTRLDVLLLGIFVSDGAVGLYSFAANIVEGIGQIPYLIRRSIDPRIAASLSRGAPGEVKAMRSKLNPLIYGSIGSAVVLAITGLWTLLAFGLIDPKFEASFGILCLMAAGMVLNGSFRSFSGFLLQAGRPALHSTMILMVFFSNVALNVMLIPPRGMYGAALAATAVYAIEAFLIDLYFRKVYGVPI